MQAWNSVKSLGFASLVESVVSGIGALTWPIEVPHPERLIWLSTRRRNREGRTGPNWQS